MYVAVGQHTHMVARGEREVKPPGQVLQLRGALAARIPHRIVARSQAQITRKYLGLAAPKRSTRLCQSYNNINMLRNNKAVTSLTLILTECWPAQRTFAEAGKGVGRISMTVGLGPENDQL